MKQKFFIFFTVLFFFQQWCLLAIDQKNDSHWLTVLLENAIKKIESHPQIKGHDIDLEQKEIEIQRGEGSWDPSVQLSQSFNENKRLSITRTDGVGTIKDSSQNTTAEINKSFESGTGVRLELNQSLSDSSSANRLSRETATSSVTLALTQSLLKNRGRKSNRFEIEQSISLKLDDLNQRKSSLEAQLLSYGSYCLDLSEATVSKSIRKEHLKIAKEEMETAKARVEQSLAARRILLAHQRNVLSLEIQLAALLRRIKTLQEEMLIQWPELQLPSKDKLKLLSDHDLNIKLKQPPLYDSTRSGREWLRRMKFDKRRLATMNQRKKDQLDLQLSYNQNGTDLDRSSSWKRLRDGDSNDWRFGLNYRHVFGRDSDRLNALSARLTERKNLELYQLAAIDWKQKRSLYIEEYRNAADDMRKRHQLLKIYKSEKQLLKEEHTQNLVRLEDVFTADKNLLNARIDMISQRVQQRRIDLKLRAHDETLLELIP